ncbi:MAG: nuclear transport factor 2 family protein [Novosphingobium sp.]
MSEFAEAEAGIRQLHARYTDATWRKDAQSFGECFTEDGEWRISGMVLKGRVEIAATIAGILSSANRVLISFGTPILTVEGKRASGRSYVNERCGWPDRPPIISIGRYYERFVEEDGRWLFSWRLFQILYWGPPDLTGTFHDPPDFGPPPGMPPLDLVPAVFAREKRQLD